MHTVPQSRYTILCTRKEECSRPNSDCYSLKKKTTRFSSILLEDVLITKRIAEMLWGLIPDWWSLHSSLLTMQRGFLMGGGGGRGGGGREGVRGRGEKLSGVVERHAIPANWSVNTPAQNTLLSTIYIHIIRSSYIEKNWVEKKRLHRTTLQTDINVRVQ